MSPVCMILLLLLLWLTLIAPISCLVVTTPLRSKSNWSLQLSKSSNVISDEEVSRLWSERSTEAGYYSHPEAIISAEEVVLACHASFKRKHRQPKGGLLSRKDNDGCGYFWDDITELEDVDSEKEPIESMPMPFTDHSKFDDPSFPDRPSASRKRHSEAARAKWSDAKWKASWYAKRWGGTSTSQRHATTIQTRIRNISTEILSSPEFLNLSELEISDAIQSYISSREKRSRLNKLRFSDKEAWYNQTMLPVYEHYQYSISSDGLVKNRQIRSDRAKRAYQTRLANLKAKEAVTSNNPVRGPTTLKISPNSMSSIYERAIDRIKQSLATDKLPSLSDVDIILVPKRLSGRRLILLKILKDGFGVSGKCIPIPNTNQYSFSSTCNIQRLGSFVKEKLVGQ